MSIVGFIFVNSTRETRENQNDNGICPIDRRARRCIDRFDGGLKLLARIRAKDYRQYYRQGQTADPQSLDCISVWNRSFKLATYFASSEKYYANFLDFSSFLFLSFVFLFFFFFYSRVRVLSLEEEISQIETREFSHACAGGS